MSRHLKVLRDAGLLVDRRVGADGDVQHLPPLSERSRRLAARPGGIGDGGNGAAGLRDRLLDWVGQQPTGRGCRASGWSG